MQNYDGFTNGNVELGADWQTHAGGFHIFRVPSARAGGRYINWLRGDNVASASGAKRISRVLPSEADLSISCEWEWLFQMGNAGNTLRFFMFANQAALDASVAGFNAYGVLITHLEFRLYRYNGGGARTLLIDADTSWINDTSEHLCRVSREVSGANRFWRLSLDDVLAGGPVNDATYGPAQGLYQGMNADERDQFGEILISS